LIIKNLLKMKLKILTLSIALATYFSSHGYAGTSAISGTGYVPDLTSFNPDETYSADLDGNTGSALNNLVIGKMTISSDKVFNINNSIFTSPPSLFNINLENQYNTNGASINQLFSPNVSSEYTFTFSDPVKLFSLTLGAMNYDWTLTAYDSSDNQLATQTISTSEYLNSNNGSWFGFSRDSGNGISYVVLKNTLLNCTVVCSGLDEIWLDYFRYVLLTGPSAADTLASMQPNASAIKNAFNSQYAALAYGLNHDCTVYDSNGVCVSVFGRNTSLNDSSYDNNAAGLVLGYKPHAQFRIGTYIDQTVNNNTMGGVKVERSNPDVGVFGVWNMNTDGSGFELRLAANYGKRDLNVSRSIVGTSEAGSGRSDLNAYGALIETSFNQALSDSWMVKPYAGVRYLSIKRDGYTEASTDNVYNPLSYSNLEQQTTSAVLGVRFNGQLAPKLIASLNAGYEHDLNHSIDDYRATGVDDLGRINMNSQKQRTRPTAGLGISYDVADKQRLSANVQYRKEIFMSESSVTGQVTYTIGF
jgi:hypothetical protein